MVPPFLASSVKPETHSQGVVEEGSTSEALERGPDQRLDGCIHQTQQLRAENYPATAQESITRSGDICLGGEVCYRQNGACANRQLRGVRLLTGLRKDSVRIGGKFGNPTRTYSELQIGRSTPEVCRPSPPDPFQTLPH